MTKKLTLTALLVGIGTLTSHIIYIPAGVAKCFPVQHMINVLTAVLLGPKYAVFSAFTISTLRNILGVGSLLAFPGSMIGAFLSALLYQYSQRLSLAALGEIIGTGILGAIAAYPLASILMGSTKGAFFFVIPFAASSIAGSIIAYLICRNKSITQLINQYIYKQ